MAWCDVHFRSDVLDKHVGMNVLLPDAGEPPFATLYLLHGLSDDYTGWLRRSRIEVYANVYPLIVVMPDGFRGFYTDNHDGPAYGRYIALDVTNFVERTFPAKRSRAARAIGGLSMGGYGALRLALAHPDRYVSCTSHSGALMSGSRNHPRIGGPLDDAEFHRIFGPKPVGTQHDIVELARGAIASKRELPKIRFDCGTEDDGLIDDNRAMHRHFTEMNVPHEYDEFPGAHDWDYWDVHVRDALHFHAKALDLPV